MDSSDSNNGPDLYDEQQQSSDAATRHPEQEHPVQDAHGGSMAPGIVDDTGNPIVEPPAVGTGG